MLPVIQRGFDSSFDVLRELDRLVTNTTCDVNRRVVGFPVDIYEAEDQLIVDAELPGYAKDQIDVSIEDDVLTISANPLTAATEDGVKPEGGQDHQSPDGSGSNHSGPDHQAQATPAPATKHHVRERRQVARVRRFSVPGTFDAGRVQASLTDGVLTLTLPKREEVKPRKVEIR